jgi:hypothetical protein
MYGLDDALWAQRTETRDQAMSVRGHLPRRCAPSDSCPFGGAGDLRGPLLDE